jgi:hypothetical protein
MTTAQILIIIFGAIGTVVSGLLVWGIKVLISTVFSTAVQIKILNNNLENLTKSYDQIDQLKKDVNAIGKKLRGDKNGND